MSKRVFEQKPGQPPMTKPEKRDAAKIAKAQQALQAQRRKIATNIGAALVVAGILVGGYFWIGSQSKSNPSASPTPGVSTSPQASRKPALPWPGVPAGADEKLKVKPVVAKPTGTVKTLKVTTLIEGKGDAITAGKYVTMNYVGVSFKDGKEFDASWNRSQNISSTIPGQLIAGWNEGLIGVKVGSRVQIDIPADKAYGETPSDGRPGGALRFVVDVLAIDDSAPEA